MKYILTFFLITFLSMSSFLSGQEKEISAPVIAQLEAYNNRNIDDFLAAYSDSVKVYSYPNTLIYQGKEIMRANYSKMFDNTPDLHCKLVSRMVQGNIVIDQEDVTIVKDKLHINAIAIYKIEDNKISEVTFIQ